MVWLAKGSLVGFRLTTDRRALRPDKPSSKSPWRHRPYVQSQGLSAQRLEIFVCCGKTSSPVEPGSANFDSAKAFAEQCVTSCECPSTLLAMSTGRCKKTCSSLNASTATSPRMSSGPRRTPLLELSGVQQVHLPNSQKRNGMRQITRTKQRKHDMSQGNHKQK